MSDSVIVQENVANTIVFVRRQKVMLDQHLAELYGVETKVLKRAVRGNFERFPADFMFPLTKEENENLRSQFGTLRWGEHPKYLPYAFTEQGVALLSLHPPKRQIGFRADEPKAQYRNDFLTRSIDSIANQPCN